MSNFMLSESLLLLTLIIALYLQPVTTFILIPSATSATCNAATEFYDTSILGCSRCASATTSSSALTPDISDINRLGLAASCTCRGTAYKETRDDSVCASTWPAPCNLETCTGCTSGQVPTRDSSRCMLCGNTTNGIDSTRSECACPPNSVVVEKNETGAYLIEKKCVACANGTHADASTQTCIQCADPDMVLVADSTGEQRCSCAATSQLVRSDVLGVTKCISRTRLNVLGTKVNQNLANTVSFSSFRAEETGTANTVVSFDSQLVQDMFVLAASECYFYRNEKQNIYCQALGNLCVLRHFDPAAPSCAVLDLIQRSGRVTTANNVNGWYNTLPFLLYQGSAVSIRESRSIGMQMSFDETANSATFDHLEFMLATYSVNGALQGFQPLSNALLYCLDASTSSSSSVIPFWTRFGVSITTRFQCDLSSMLQSSRGVPGSEMTELYELYLVDRSKSERDDNRYIPVPVRNLNYQDGRGLLLNQNKGTADRADDVLSHRFFLVDVVSGVRVGETKTKVIRYADTITLTIKTQSGSSSVDRIYPPLLSISYVDTQTTTTPVSVTFQAIYTSDTTSYRSSAVSILIVCCVIAGARVILHTYTWQRRNTRNEEMALTMWHSMSQLITSIVANYARAFFVILYVLCVYYLLFFKLQSTVFCLLPEWINDPNGQSSRVDDYAPFRIVLPMAFAFQLATVLYLIYQQTRVQLFFMDWEKPRAKIMDVDSHKPQSAPVSIWRTILVANEWNELQTVRNTSLRFTLLVMLFLLYGCDLRSLALPIPRAQLQHAATSSPTVMSSTDEDLAMNLFLRFASVSSLWLLLCLAQRLYRWLLHGRFFDEPKEQMFIDLCTVAKVSCLIIDETYHGFYLHCRSPYPFADGSMGELVEQMKQEAAGLTVGRGLDSSVPECQSFELFLTRKWKRKYLSLYNAIHNLNANDGGGSKAADRDHDREHDKEMHPRQPLGRNGPGARVQWNQPSGRAGWHSSSSASFLGTTQNMVTGATQLSGFLKGFVENQDDQFKWRIYRLETCMSRFFGLPPDMTVTRQSYFLPDMDSRFCRVLFLGIENDLMLMDILCFTAFDLWFSNHAISALATYLLAQVLTAIRQKAGHQNVARNTLVDARFLI